MIKIGLLVMATSTALTFSPVSMENIYPETAIVTEVNTEEDIVTVTTFTGNEFQFYGAEDWCSGDIASLIMNNNDTETIADDEIVSIKYSGYLK